MTWRAGRAWVTPGRGTVGGLAVVVVLAAVVLPVARATSRPNPMTPSVPLAAPAQLTPLALNEIQGARIKAHLRFLSDDLLEGRAPASRGGDLAARYVAAQFAAIGLTPGGDDSTFFQQVPIVESVVEPGFTLSAQPTDMRAVGGRTFHDATDIVAFTDGTEATVDVQGEVVFVGYGIVAPEYRWDDYAGTDVRGKIVLAMVNDPVAPADEPDLFEGHALTYYGRWTYKFEEAARQGASGAILIHTTESATYPWQVVQSSWSGSQYALPPAPGRPGLALKAWMTEDAARALADTGGADLDRLRSAAAVRGAVATPLAVGVSGRIVQRVRRQESPNVIGVVEGRNPGEAVVYTSHYDHLGMRDGAAGEDRIYNGALDNASGLSGVLAIAQAFARADARPARSIYFVATTAEEAGLLGSEHLAAHPPVPIDRIAANINVDGLNVWGLSADIVLLGAERSSLGEIAERIAAGRGRRVGLDGEPERGYFFRSDHFPLAKAGVPALSLADATEYPGKPPGFARQVHDRYVEDDYHQPGDEFDEGWVFDGAVDDLRLLAELGWSIAEAASMPAYHEGDQFRRPRDATP